MNAQKVIAELDEDIVKLEADITELKSARATIVKLYGGNLPEEPKPAKIKRARKNHPGPDRAALQQLARETLPASEAPDPVEAPPVGGVQIDPRMLNNPLLTAVRKLPEPFTVQALVVAGQCVKGRANSFLHNLKVKGLIKNVAFGQYERTKLFPPLP